jgi:DNA-binding response OmpR family regulator
MGIAEKVEHHSKQHEQQDERLEEYGKQLDEILDLVQQAVGALRRIEQAELPRGTPTRIEGDVLVVLERRWGEVVPHDKIIELVWPTANPEWARKHGVPRAIAGLRRKGFRISSVRGRGYRLLLNATTYR